MASHIGLRCAKLATHLWRREARVEWWVCFLSNWSLTILYICSQSGLLCPLPTSANALFLGGIFTHWETPVRAGVSAFWQLVSNNSIHLCCTGAGVSFFWQLLISSNSTHGCPSLCQSGVVPLATSEKQKLEWSAGTRPTKANEWTAWWKAWARGSLFRTSQPGQRAPRMKKVPDGPKGRACLESRLWWHRLQRKRTCVALIRTCVAWITLQMPIHQM